MNYRWSVALFCLLLGACAGSAAFREGRDLAADGKLEAALPKLRVASEDHPDKAEYRAAYLRTRERLWEQWLAQASRARRKGQNEEAEKIYRRLLAEDPENGRAREGLADMARETRHAILVAEVEAAIKKGDPEAATAKLRTVLSENPDDAKALELKRGLNDKAAKGSSQPRLSASLRKPITIEFKDAPLRQIFEVLSRTSGLNFVFDKDVKGEQRATVFLRNSSVQEALNLLLLTNQLEQRVLDGNSILIYPNTAAKLKDYQALMVKTFFLSNVDVKSAANTLKTILRSKDVVVDEKQNLITMRDTPDAVRLAEKILNLHDLAEPEVMLEVTILEVTRTQLLNLGIRWPSQLSLSPLAGASGNVTLADLRRLNSSMVGATLSPLTINADEQDGNVNILANPRIRARNRETAKIMIGDRIPNITTTSTATGFVSENIQYVDIGLKLEVQPTVYADNEVAIKISLEVSNIVNQVQTKSGSLAYQIGTRNASTLLKLKDGENQVLAGLIRSDDSSTGSRIPGLGDIPLLGRLFGSQKDDATKTEIILSITPRLIRNTRHPELSAAEFDSGTETSLRSQGIENSAAATTPAASSHTSLNTLPSAGATPYSDAAPLESGGDAMVPASPTAGNWQGPQQVKAGSAFTLQLAIQPGEPVTSVPLALSFDPKVLEVTGVTEGDFLKQGRGTTNFSNRVDRGSGQVFATITRSGQDGASAPGNLVTVAFRAIAPTTGSRIQVSAIAPIGLAGRSVNAAAPPPYSISVTP